MARQLSAAVDTKSLRFPSWCLSHLLNRILGTKELLALRRKYDSMVYYTGNVNTSFKVLYSGSQGEGFNFQSSDLDLMFIDENTTVLESIHSERPDEDKKTVLLLTREGCNPGFVILRLLNRTNDRTIRESLVEYDGYPVVSRILYRDVHSHAEYGDVGHGPCNTCRSIREVDVAHCFECNMWPIEANEFIYRHRPYGWPCKRLLDKIICRGFHLVPIGDKNSDVSHIQWRLSFSAAEKDLVHSFNHTQFLVYGLMKVFLKQLIDKFNSAADILCSYFLKTAMFFSIKSTPSSFWRDDFLVPCFWFCLNKLINWVERGYCPNYFVPQNNMFRGKVFGENQHNLLTVLNLCKRSGWTCICLCKDLQSLGLIVKHPESIYIGELIPGEHERECFSDNTINLALCRSYLVDPQRMHRQLVRTLTLLRYARTQKEEDISMLLLYGVLRNKGLRNPCNYVGINNKDKYRISYHMMLSSAASNIYTGSLYLATFYYLNGQYKKVVYLCNRVISQWKPYVMYHSTGHKTAYNAAMYQRYVCGRCLKVLDKVKSAFAFNIYIKSATKGFYPVELRQDVEASDPFPVQIPPLPYTVFLLFLCHHKLRNIGSSVNALYDL